MATVYWVGNATAVAQVHTGSIDSVDGTPANNTFTVTIGGVAIDAVGDTDVATTATNLRASLNASTHPYFAGITWSGSTGDIIGTADTAGVPFVAALTETGAGTGAVTDFAETTASAGPSDASTGDNWSGGAVPSAADTVIMKDNAVPIAYNLDTMNALSLALLRIDQSMTGLIGLDASQFATDTDGTSVEATLTGATTTKEYRATYLDVGWDRAEVGQHFGPGSPVGSARIKIDNAKAGASDTVIYDTHNSGETQKPAVRLLAAHASADVYIRACPGSVGIAADVPGETATVGDVVVSTSNANHRVFVESGVTLTSYTQDGGTGYVKGAATITTVELNGGTLYTEGTQAVTTLTVNDGTAYANSTGTITTCTLNGGALDLNTSLEARTITTLNPAVDATLSTDAHITITTNNEPTGKYSVTWSDA